MRERERDTEKGGCEMVQNNVLKAVQGTKDSQNKTNRSKKKGHTHTCTRIHTHTHTYTHAHTHTGTSPPASHDCRRWCWCHAIGAEKK